MESTYLKTLLEVVRTGSFSKASENLCVTQSAVSRRVRCIEEHYGKALLDRTGPAITPTAAGRLVLEKAEAILLLERELAQGLSSLQTKTRFSFSCTPTFGMCYLPRLLESFMMKNADLIDINVTFDSPANLVSGLNAGVFDMAVIDHCACLDLSEFVIHPLPSDEVVFVTSSGSRFPDILSQIDPLFTETLFTRKEGCCSRILLEKNLNRLGKSVSDFARLVVLDDLRLIVEAVRIGKGVTFTSTDIVAAEVAAGNLAQHRVAGFEHERNRSIVSVPEAQRDSFFLNFKELVERSFGVNPDAAPGSSPGCCDGKAELSEWAPR